MPLLACGIVMLDVTAKRPIFCIRDRELPGQTHARIRELEFTRPALGAAPGYRGGRRGGEVGGNLHLQAAAGAGGESCTGCDNGDRAEEEARLSRHDFVQLLFLVAAASIARPGCTES